MIITAGAANSNPSLCRGVDGPYEVTVKTSARGRRVLFLWDHESLGVLSTTMPLTDGDDPHTVAAEYVRTQQQPPHGGLDGN
jgi:hypothetical protein